MKMEQERFIPIPDNSDYYTMELVYDGHNPLSWCLWGYRYNLQSSWANSGLSEGEAPLVHLSHYFDDQSWIHKFLCINEDWDTRYYGIESWGINEGVSWYRVLTNSRLETEEAEVEVQ